MRILGFAFFGLVIATFGLALVVAIALALTIKLKQMERNDREWEERMKK